MNTKNLPHNLSSITLAHPTQLFTGLQLTQLIILLILSVISWHQPVHGLNIHPSEQPTPYKPIYAQMPAKDKIKQADKADELVTVKQTSPQPFYAESNVSAGLQLIKQCESGGNYRAVNPAGYYGAYQFNPGTWSSTANAAGRSDLVGIRPDRASPADQDAMAVKLHSLRGWQPWGCAYHVGLL